MNQLLLSGLTEKAKENLSMIKSISIVMLILTGVVSFGQKASNNKINMENKIVYDFVKAINDHNAGKIYSVMTDDHKFIDAHSNEMSGKDKMRAGWTGYFQLSPDYKIEITDIFSQGETLAAFGFASGTFKGIKSDTNANYWRLPAAWKILLSYNKVKLWQVYADTKIPFDIIGKSK